MTRQGTGPITPLYRSSQIPEILFWSEVPQSIHNYAAPFITIILPLTNFFLSASATQANIIRICRNTAETTNRLARADYLLSRILAHTKLSAHNINQPHLIFNADWFQLRLQIYVFVIHRSSQRSLATYRHDIGKHHDFHRIEAGIANLYPSRKTFRARNQMKLLVFLTNQGRF